VSHSKRRTNRQWSVNSQKKTLLVNGKKVRVNICTRCLRNQHKLPS